MVGLAYEMKRAGYLNAIVEMMFALSIHLRCGMNTGNVLVGLILTEKRDQFTTIGTNVNLASRMEGVATEDQIIASPFTKMRIEDEFNLKTVSVKKPIKGFENISKCYEIVGKKDTISSI
jgi:adenylate cyclase